VELLEDLRIRGDEISFISSIEFFIHDSTFLFKMRPSNMCSIDELKSHLEISKPACRPFEIWALGIAIVIGGDYFSWNSGISSGFGSFFIATLLIGSAYISLILSTSEMLSALPFAGGAYGLARCTLGFFPGFLVGCSEALEYIIYAAISAVALTSMLISLLGGDKKYQPLYCLVFYLVTSSIHIHGGSLFWKFNNLIGAVSILLVVVYCLGALAWVDFQANVVNTQPFFIGGVAGFLHILPLPAWFYVGVESLAFSCNMVLCGDPKVIVPRGSISCVITLFVTSIWVLFVCNSLPPGAHQVASEPVPLNGGFALIFRCSSTCATVLSLPATFATAYGFIFSYGKLLHALAASRLLPEVLARTSEAQGTPFSAIICGSLVSYGICLLVFFVPSVSDYLFNICILCAFVAYCTQCIGYWFMKTKFSRINRLFKSPLGLAGAWYAFFIYFFGIISVIGFQEDQQTALISTLVVWALLSAYYFSYAKYKQTFSADEQKILLVAHVINHNIRGAAQRRAKKKVKKVTVDKAGISSVKESSAMQTTFSVSKVPVYTKRLTTFKHPKLAFSSKTSIRRILVQPQSNTP